MRIWTTFSQLVLCLSAGLLTPGLALAYVHQCKSIWAEEYLPAVTPETAQGIESAMTRYQAMMGFETIGHKKADIDAVKARLQTLSPTQRAELMSLVRDQYGAVKAFKYSENKSIKSFKRQIDVVLTESTEAAKTIAQEYQKHGRIETALDAYYKRVQEAADTPVRMQGDDVLLTAIRLRHEFFGEGKPTGQGPIVLYGSFVNGRSFPKSSDLDFAVLNASLETRLRETDLVTQLQEFPFSEAQPHMVSPKQVHELGYLNNIVVLVRANYIEVRVYHSHPSTDFAQASSRFDVYYF